MYKLQPEGVLDLLLQIGPYGNLPLGLTPLAERTAKTLIKALSAIPQGQAVAQQLEPIVISYASWW